MPTLSVIVIARNEARHIADCVRSAAFADEVIVLDSGSSDDTVDQARAAGAKVFVDADWQGFGVQKNRALALATGDWVLSLDADEIVPRALREEILATLRAPKVDVYAMPRLSSFCGHWMRHGGWWPDPVTRLFRRGAARFSDDRVHERLLHDGAPAMLRAHLKHYSYDDYEQALDKMNRYSTLGAQQAHAAGKRATLADAWLRGGWAFVRTFVLKRGFLDGRAGWLLARYNAQTTFWKYVKLTRLRS